jgi:AcrR family transcriptional regulator
VRSAAYELLAERGYEAIEIPDIAARAGVNRTTVYRRWRSKAELLLDVVLDDMRAKVPTPDTGSFEGDLKALLKSIAKALGDPGLRNLLHLLVGRPGTDGPGAAALARFWNERLAISGEIVSRAIACGEVDGDVSPRAVLELAAAPLFYRILILGEVVDDRAATEIAAWVIGQDLKRFPLPGGASRRPAMEDFAFGDPETRKPASG